MKNKLYLLITMMVILIGCKKYENDAFYSTYTPEGRLTKGGVWTCTKIKRENGKEIILNDFQYFFDFRNEGQSELSFGMLNNSMPEFFSLTDWSFDEKKSYLNFNGKWKIQKLTVNQMELIDEIGSTYYFTKISRDVAIEFIPLDTNLIGIPLHGIHSKITTLTQFNNCEQISEITGTSTVSPLVTIAGLSQNAIGGNASTLGSYNFEHTFNKAGMISFWLKGLNSHLTNIKINGQSCTFSIGEINGTWQKIIIEIPSAGNKQFTIPTSASLSGGMYNVVNGIDEIRFWEYE